MRCLRIQFERFYLCYNNLIKWWELKSSSDKEPEGRWAKSSLLRMQHILLDFYPYPLCPHLSPLHLHLFNQKATYWNPFSSLWLRSFVCLWEQAWPACGTSQMCRKFNSLRSSPQLLTDCWWINTPAPSPLGWDNSEGVLFYLIEFLSGIEPQLM